MWWLLGELTQACVPGGRGVQPPLPGQLPSGLAGAELAAGHLRGVRLCVRRSSGGRGGGARGGSGAGVAPSRALFSGSETTGRFPGAPPPGSAPRSQRVLQAAVSGALRQRRDWRLRGIRGPAGSRGALWGRGASHAAGLSLAHACTGCRDPRASAPTPPSRRPAKLGGTTAFHGRESGGREVGARVGTERLFRLPLLPAQAGSPPQEGRGQGCRRC